VLDPPSVLRNVVFVANAPTTAAPSCVFASNTISASVPGLNSEGPLMETSNALYRGVTEAVPVCVSPVEASRAVASTTSAGAPPPPQPPQP
jgi:hypothetical protein